MTLHLFVYIFQKYADSLQRYLNFLILLPKSIPNRTPKDRPSTALPKTFPSQYPANIPTPIPSIIQLFCSAFSFSEALASGFFLRRKSMIPGISIAAAMAHTGLADVLAKRITLLIKNNKFMLLLVLTLLACASQNLIPVHIAFIPVIIPPLIHLMNKLKLDRRAVACALAFGLVTPYIVFPAGFGLIFQRLLADNMTTNGMPVTVNDVWKSVWILGVGLLCGLLWAVFVSYRKPREYENIQFREERRRSLRFTGSHYITLFAAVATLGVQLWTKSLPLGALIGLTIIFGTRAIDPEKMDILINEGIGLMGYVAFVMLVAAGFAGVLQSTGAIDSLVNGLIPFMMGSKLLAAFLMLIVGLFITIGIGTSFGTIPILAVLFVPIFIHLGFNPLEAIAVFAAAAALGDAGSPASGTTLGPTQGLNIDGQHEHIKDTCIPTFLHYNLPLILFALLAVILF